MVSKQKYKPLIRSTKDVMITSKKGTGKSQTLTKIGFLAWRYAGVKVFANFKTVYPSVYIGNLEDLRLITEKYNKYIPKIFLGDDFEKWIFSRKSGSDENMEIINEILLDWGKHNISGYYVGKRELSLDIGLREEAQEFWETELRLKIRYISEDKEIQEKCNRILKKYIDFLKIHIYRFNEFYEPLDDFEFKDLRFIGSLYDTTEKIKTVYNTRQKTRNYSRTSRYTINPIDLL